MARAHGESSSRLGTDWQLGCGQLKERGGHLLQTGQWSDCTFVVGVEPHQITFRAHKLILASASPVFEAMFFGGMAEKDAPIKILDVQPSAFKLLLLYIYTDRTTITNVEKACSVYYAAKKYMLPYLEKECTWFISLNLNAQNVCRTYELAQLFDENLLIEKCLKIMETHTKEILSDESFLDVDLETLNKLLSLERLSVESELDLFNAVERYAKLHLKGGQYKRRSMSDVSSSCECSLKKRKFSEDGDEPLNCSTNDKSVISMNENGPNCTIDSLMELHEETGELIHKPVDLKTEDIVQTSVALLEDESLKAEDLSKAHYATMYMSQMAHDSYRNIDRSSLREAIGKIRFLTLTATAFAAGPAHSPLLSESEAFAVLMNILSSQTDVPMPQGFSASRLLRIQQSVECAGLEARAEAVFRFTVLNVKARRRSVESRPFALHDAPWTLRLVPRHDADTNNNEYKYFGLYLRWAGKKDKTFRCKVHATVRMLAQQPLAAPVCGTIDHVFTSAEPEFGIDRFVSWDAVMSPERGLLRNNAVLIEAHLLADKP